jgi:hypothetical protein
MGCPATVNVAVRGLRAVLPVTEKTVVPLPEPLLPDVMVSQLALSDAVQVQPVGAVTVSVLLLLAFDGRFCEDGVTV